MSCTRLHALVYELYQTTCTCICVVSGNMHLYMSCTGLHALVYELYQATCTCIWVVPDYMHLYMSCTRLHALVYEVYQTTCTCFPMLSHEHKHLLWLSFFSYIFQNNPKWSLPFPHFKQQAFLSLSLYVELTWFWHKKGWTSTHHHNTLLWLGI